MADNGDSEATDLAGSAAFFEYISELRETWQPDKRIVEKHAPHRVSVGIPQ